MWLQRVISLAYPAIFVIWKFVDPTRAMEYILYFMQHAGHTRVAMKYKIYSMAHAVRVGLSEMQWKITLSRGTNRVFWLDNLNLRYDKL